MDFLSSINLRSILCLFIQILKFVKFSFRPKLINICCIFLLSLKLLKFSIHLELIFKVFSVAFLGITYIKFCLLSIQIKFPVFLVHFPWKDSCYCLSMSAFPLRRNLAAKRIQIIKLSTRSEWLTVCVCFMSWLNFRRLTPYVTISKLGACSITNFLFFHSATPLFHSCT